MPERNGTSHCCPSVGSIPLVSNRQLSRYRFQERGPAKVLDFSGFQIPSHIGKGFFQKRMLIDQLLDP